MTYGQTASVCGGEISGNTSAAFRGICLDTRKNFKDSLFICLSGERFDGHDFMENAITSGSSCIMWCEDDRKKQTEELKEKYPEVCFIKTQDTLKALGSVCAGLLREYRERKIKETGREMKVVAVTGSVGKTTTKEMTAKVLSCGYNVCKSEGNHNNEIGVPLTIMSLTDQDALVTEMGMRGLGQIEYLSEMVRPDIGIITNIGNAHLELLGSRSRIFMAKTEIVTGMKDGDTLIVNGDCDYLSNKVMLDAYIKKVFSKKLNIFTVGEGEHCDFRISGYEEKEESCSFDFTDTEGRTERIEIPQAGRHISLDTGLALAAGVISGVDIKEASERLRTAQTEPLRQKIGNLSGITYIDDTYNANPESMRASLSVLGKYKGRRIAVLGDMMELGEDSPKLHRETGIFAASKADILITAGKMSVFLGEGFKEEKEKEGLPFELYNTEDSNEAGKTVSSIAKAGDIILFKGSRGTYMEKALERFSEVMKK